MAAVRSRLTQLFGWTKPLIELRGVSAPEARHIGMPPGPVRAFASRLVALGGFPSSHGGCSREEALAGFVPWRKRGRPMEASRRSVGGPSPLRVGTPSCGATKARPPPPGNGNPALGFGRAHRRPRGASAGAAELSPASRCRRAHRLGPEREGRLQGDSPLSAHRQDDWPLLRVHDRSHLPAGLLWPGRPEQHAVADERGSESEGRLGAELLDLRAGRPGEAGAPGVDSRAALHARDGPCRLLQALQERLPVRGLLHLL